MKYINLLLFSLFMNGLLSSYLAQAGFPEEVVDIEETSIIGNRELPKVLYIVPWKQSQLPDMDSLPIDRLVDEALAPIERKEFQRQINFHEQLNPIKNEN